MYIYFSTLVMGGGMNTLWMMNIHYHPIKGWEPQKKTLKFFQNPTVWIIWSRIVHLPEFFLLGTLFWNSPLSCQTAVFAVFPCYTYMLLLLLLFFLIWKYWRANVSEMLLKEMLLQTTFEATCHVLGKVLRRDRPWV